MESELSRAMLDAEKLTLRVSEEAGRTHEVPTPITGHGEDRSGQVGATVTDGRVEHITADSYWLRNAHPPEIMRGIADAVNAALEDCERAARQEADKLNAPMAELRDALAKAQQEIITAMTADMDAIIDRAARKGSA